MRSFSDTQMAEPKLLLSKASLLPGSAAVMCGTSLYFPAPVTALLLLSLPRGSPKSRPTLLLFCVCRHSSFFSEQRQLCLQSCRQLWACPKIASQESSRSLSHTRDGLEQSGLLYGPGQGLRIVLWSAFWHPT